MRKKNGNQKDIQKGDLLLSRRCSKCHEEIGFGLFAHEMQCEGLTTNHVTSTLTHNHRVKEMRMMTVMNIDAHEAVHVPSYSEFKPRLSVKPVTAKLTDTERRVLALIGDGLNLGCVSYPLLYSRVLSVSKSERQALFNLIYNRRIQLVRENCPDTYIVQPVTSPTSNE